VKREDIGRRQELLAWVDSAFGDFTSGKPHQVVEQIKEIFWQVDQRATVEAEAKSAARIAELERELAEAKAAVPVLPTDWLIHGSLLYRLSEHEVNCDEINITMADGSRKEAPRRQRAEAILAMLAAPIAVAEQTGQEQEQGNG